MTQAIVNGPIFDGVRVWDAHAVLFDQRKTVGLKRETDLPPAVDVVCDLQGAMLIPGFIDLQVNGGGGVLFNEEPSVAGIRAILEAHRRFGTTALFPTLISTDFATMAAAIHAVDAAIEQGLPGVLGIHLEGPYLNPQRRGAHAREQLQPFDDEAIDLLSSLRRGRTIVTLAPELVAPDAIAELKARGVIVCAGHSQADAEETQQALAAGVQGFTHLFNAMTPMASRAPGMVGAALADPQSWFGIIADGHHVHPTAFRVAIAAKRRGGAVLVTDAMPLVGSESASFSLYGETITCDGGRCINAAGSLAGSSLTMIDAVRNAARFAGLDWFEAVRMASIYPATVTGLAEYHGRIAPGCVANYAIIDAQRHCVGTVVQGQVHDFSTAGGRP